MATIKDGQQAPASLVGGATFIMGKVEMAAATEVKVEMHFLTTVTGVRGDVAEGNTVSRASPRNLLA